MRFFIPLVNIAVVALPPVGIFAALAFITDNLLISEDCFDMLLDITSVVANMNTVGFTSYRNERVRFFNNPKPYTFFQKMCDLKDYYYNERIIISGTFEDLISVYGLEFKIDREEGRYVLSDRLYDAVDLVCICHTLLRVMGNVNDRGYIRLNFLNNTFITDITKHLLGLGYKTKVWGNDELTYTMWHNFLFVNLYYLVVKTLRDHNYHKLNFKNQSVGSTIVDGLCLDGIDLDFYSQLELLGELDF